MTVIDSDLIQDVAAIAAPRPTVDLEVIVPALNERARLPETLDQVTRYLARLSLSAAVVVVDNGSIDGTADVVYRAADRAGVPIHLIGCVKPGKGAAVRRGVLTGTSRIVGFQDADLASPIETLDPILRRLGTGSSVAIASRRCEGSSVERRSIRRRMGSIALHQLSGSLVRGLTDTQCGFKFFNGETARELFAHCRIDGFAFDVEVLARARAAGYVVSEVPVAWTDQEGSTFRVLRDGLHSIRDVIRIRRALHPSRI